MRRTLAVAVLLLVGCRTMTCPPDNRPVFRERSCKKAYSNYANELTVDVKTRLGRILSTVGVELKIQTKVVSLSEKFDQTTVRFRSALTALCQLSAQDPCNADLEHRILETTLIFINLTGDIKRGVDSIDRTASASHSVEERKQVIEKGLNDLETKLDAAVITIENLTTLPIITPPGKSETMVTGTSDDKKAPGTSDDKKAPGTPDDKKAPGTSDDKKAPGTSDDKKNLNQMRHQSLPLKEPGKPKILAGVYRVKSGDNLSRIAERAFGRQDWPRLLRANKNSVKNPNLIFPDQRLVIPK